MRAILLIITGLTLFGYNRLFGSSILLDDCVQPIPSTFWDSNAINLVIHSPAPVCFPSTINLEDPQITRGSNLDGVELTYWEDSQASSSLANHTSVTLSGTYYIKATNQDHESMVLPVVVVINPIPSMTSVPDQAICIGNTQPAIPLLSSVANTSFLWSNSNTSIGLAGSGITNLTVPSFVASGSSMNSQTTSIITVQPTANGCTGSSKSYRITVNPLPAATITGTTSTCQGSDPPIVTFIGSNSIPPYTFIYQINGGFEQTISTISGNSVSLHVWAYSSNCIKKRIFWTYRSSINAINFKIHITLVITLI